MIKLISVGILIIFGLFTANTDQPINMNNTKIIYAFDPLCGWCYGFSPVIEKFSQENPNIEIDVVPGGMITGERIGPIGEVAPYIAWAYKDVEKATGVKFGENFLEGTLKEGSAVFTSIPLSKALAYIISNYPDKAMEAAGLSHKAVYYEGLKPMEDELYIWLAQKLNIESDELLSGMKTADVSAKVTKGFEKSSSLGVSGFPSLFLTDGEQYIKFGEGYMPFDTLESRYKAALDMVKN